MQTSSHEESASTNMEMKEDCQYRNCKRKAWALSVEGVYLCEEHYNLDRYIEKKIDKVVDLLGLAR